MHLHEDGNNSGQNMLDTYCVYNVRYSETLESICCFLYSIKSAIIFDSKWPLSPCMRSWMRLKEAAGY